MPDEKLIDVFVFLANLDQERYRTAVIHAPPEKGPAVTQFARKACAHISGKYLDLLDLFIGSKELNEHIASFGPEKFRKLLIDESKGTSVLFVDRADFLLDTWRRTEHQNFYRMLDKQWDSFMDTMKAKLIVCLQSSQEIEELRITDSHRQSRLLRLSDFRDIA